MVTSSRYTITDFPIKSLSTSFIILWKVAGALQSPNGILVHSHSPSGVMKAEIRVALSVDQFAKSQRKDPIERYSRLCLPSAAVHLLLKVAGKDPCRCHH